MAMPRPPTPSRCNIPGEETKGSRRERGMAGGAVFIAAAFVVSSRDAQTFPDRPARTRAGRLPRDPRRAGLCRGLHLASHARAPDDPGHAAKRRSCPLNRRGRANNRPNGQCAPDRPRQPR
jgi:hypothetical protein